MTQQQINANNNSSLAFAPQLPFSPYEVRQQTLQSGLSAFPQVPGYTPVLMNIPAYDPSAFPMHMPLQPFNPMFLQPNPVLQGNSVSPQLSPVFFPMPNFPVNNVPSLSPPMLSLSPMPPQSAPMINVSSPPLMTPSRPPTQNPQTNHFLGSGLRDISRSRSASVASDSDSGENDRTRYRSISRESGTSEAPSKRALVDSTLGWMESVFGDKYDNDGTRGENVLRLKVKTVVALEHIVEFISRCHSEGLIESISCPVSTKKGRQHVRGYLAYIKGFSGGSADRIQTIFEAFNSEKGFPFKTLHRNPASTL